MFHGSNVALVTPFANSNVDEAALVRLVRVHLEAGTHGIVPVGTTGEASTLSRGEHERVIDVVVNEVAGQVPVIAGTGSNNPAEAISYTQYAAKAGANAALNVMGYYNRPNQEGVYQHFRALHDATDIPLFVYNVPARAVIDIQPETMARLAMLERIVGVKDASNDLSRPVREYGLIRGEFCFLSGEDPTAIAYNAQGGCGCISVTANIAPTLCAQMQNACADGRYSDALEVQRQLMPLHRALFLEPSPAGVKYACSLMGLTEADCRLPMVELRDTTKRIIADCMRKLELIE